MFFAHLFLGVILLLGLQARAGEVPTPAAQEQLIKVTAKRFEYSPSVIQVKLNVPVVLELSTLDRVHGFEVPDLALRGEIKPGEGDQARRSDEDPVRSRQDRNVRLSLQRLLRKRPRRHVGTNRGDEVAKAARPGIPARIREIGQARRDALISGTSLENLTRLPLPSPGVLPPSGPTEEAWTLRTIGGRRSSRHSCIA